jgi:hypothetical protein
VFTLEQDEKSNYQKNKYMHKVNLFTWIGDGDERGNEKGM